MAKGHAKVGRCQFKIHPASQKMRGVFVYKREGGEISASALTL